VNILFFNPPFLPKYSRESRSPAVTKSGTLYYPAWLAYAAGYAEKKGHTIDLIDAVADDLTIENVLDRCNHFKPELLVVGTSTPSIYNDIEKSIYLKNNIQGNIKIVLVGTHASSSAHEIIENNSEIDFVARREYDETIPHLANIISSSQDYSIVKGISWRSNEGIVHNEDRDYIQDLDQLPFASKLYKRYFTIKNYFYAHVPYPMVSIFTSRGCNAKCDFCVYPQTMFGKFRARSPKNIAAEFKWIAEELPEVKGVLIDDDTFTMDQDHAIEVSKALIKVNNRIPFICEVRANLKYETMIWLRKAGCKLVVVGFESTDQRILNNMRKGMKMTLVHQFVEDAKKAKLKVHGCFMAGNPGDTKETLENTLQFAIKHNFDTVQFFPLQVYPGTRAYNWAIDNEYLSNTNYRDLITEDGNHNCLLERPDLSSIDLLDFCDAARRRYYLRPRFLLYKLIESIKDPRGEGVKTIKSFRTFYKHLFYNVSS
tara:strand:- start:1669 stop:3123 length:1455 start_codon:yes stop_codon:yes gene_type:complete